MSPLFTILRIVCLAQITICVFLSVLFAFNLVRFPDISVLIQLLSFILAVWLAGFAMQLLQKNYPDIPVAGRQKTIFNWLFILNFLLLSFHFAYVIGDIKALMKAGREMKLSVFKLPIHMFASTALYCLVSVFQMIILYGLFRLRRTVYINFCRELSELDRNS